MPLRWCDSALGRRSNGTLNCSTAATDLLSGLIHADPVAILCPVPPPVEAGLGHEPGSPAKRLLAGEVPMSSCRIWTPRPRSVLGVVFPLRDRVFASFSWTDRRDDRCNGVSVRSRSRFGEPGRVLDFDVDVNFYIIIDAWPYRRKALGPKVGIEFDLETAVVLGGGSGANRHRNHETKSENCRDKRQLHKPLGHFNHLLRYSSGR